MSVQDFQRQVTEMTAEELKQFSKWFENYQAEVWDAQIERDANAGKLDFLVRETEADYNGGKCAPL